MELIKWFRQGDQFKRWLQQERMTAYDYISDTGCISDKSKSCVRIKAHVLDTSKHDASAGGRHTVGEQASAFPASSPVKFQDSIWFSPSKSEGNRLLCQLEQFHWTVNRQCLKACHWASHQKQANSSGTPNSEPVKWAFTRHTLSTHITADVHSYKSCWARYFSTARKEKASLRQLPGRAGVGGGCGPSSHTTASSDSRSRAGEILPQADSLWAQSHALMSPRLGERELKVFLQHLFCRGEIAV